MWDSLRALGRRVNWWLGLAGNISLVYVLIFGGAAATIITTVVAYAVSFLDWVSGVPLFFRLMFYASVFVLSFALVNHGWQWWVIWRSQSSSTPQAPTVTVYREAVGETRRHPLQVEEETDEEFLIRRCQQLAQELSGFADRWEKFRDAGAETDIASGDHRDWPRDTMKEYRRHEFDRKLASLLDDLEQLGRLTAEQRKYFNVPTDNAQTIREVAGRLSAICY
jgi:hypothetical protein